MGDEPGLAIALRSRFHTLRDYTSCLKTRELAAAQPSQLRWSAVGRRSGWRPTGAPLRSGFRVAGT